MTLDWTQLENEFDRWRAAGRTLPVWWRDDDAVAPGMALDRLGDLAQSIDIPVHLAVIPKTATTALGDHVQARSQLIPVMHGWAHRNHAGVSEKKAEFGDHRLLADMRDEIAQGHVRLSRLFGPRLRGMFVPPWNRIAPQLISELAGLGFQALSTFTPRVAALAAPGLAQVNTHLDPIAWKAGRGLADPDALIALLVQHLNERRTGQADNSEPYGILTHHLVHDDAIWDFTGALLNRLAEGPVRRWDISELNQKDTTP